LATQQYIWITYLYFAISVSELYEYALLPEHLTSVDPHITPTTIADNGALSVSSGQKTGRTPKEKRVVLDETTKDVRICIRVLICNSRKFGGAASTCLSLIRDTIATSREPSTSSTLGRE